jgi:hypothetical protein
MRAPWTVLRDLNAELRVERDERAELIALRKERIVLRTMLWTGYAGLLALAVLWGAPGSGRTAQGGVLLAVLVGVMLVGGVATFVARIRHGEADSPEAKRADATRGLFLLPGTLVGVAFVYWYMGNGLVPSLVFASVAAVASAGGLLLRRAMYASEARRVASEDSTEDSTEDRDPGRGKARPL